MTANPARLAMALWAVVLALAAPILRAQPAPAGNEALPPGAKPGDETLGCMQIAMELQPFMARSLATFGPLAQTSQEVVARGQERVAEAMPGAVALTIAATASAADPTGVASRAVGQAEMAYQESVAQRSLIEDKPLHDKFKAQTDAALADAQKMQADARLQRLMQLAQEKKCDQQH
jgi:hypothetical protein